MHCDLCACETFIIHINYNHENLCEGCYMGLREKQSIFARKIAVLKLAAIEMGYEITEGDYYAKSGHKMDSFHYKRLAADLNLFKDGVYLSDTEDHQPVGELWEKFGGTWGGRFQNKDGNHYSWGCLLVLKTILYINWLKSMVQGLWCGK